MAKNTAFNTRRCENLYQAFVRVKAYVIRRTSGHRASRVSLRACGNIRDGLRGAARRRAFMHTGHMGDHICTNIEASKLEEPFLIGILLHEFGHIFTGAGERKADQWVFEVLGVPLQYKGTKKLEWVDPKVLEAKGI